MFTSIYSLGKVNGAEIMLLGWFVCAIVYIGLCMLCRENRTRQGRGHVIWYLLASEVVTDIVWALLYYEDGHYVNYGISSMYGALIWPVVLLTAGIFVTMQNKEKVLG